MLESRARECLTEIATKGRKASADVIGEIVSIVFLEIWLPNQDTCNEAPGSGRLNLISDPQPRIELSRYNSRVSNIENMIIRSFNTQYYEELEPFLVANTVYSDIALATRCSGLIRGTYDTDFEALAQSRELWNLLTPRLELERDLDGAWGTETVD